MTTTEVRQYSRWAVLAVWTAAALPMGLAAWVIAPRLATGRLLGEVLIAVFTAGLVWQFVLVVALVAYEQRSLRWSVIRDALWLGPPTDHTGRRGGRLWLWAVALTGFIGLVELAGLGPKAPADRDPGTLLRSDQGHELLRGNWGLFALVVILCLFNTVLGEELLFRGLLLPRMRGGFGRWDWLANGLLFGLYHLHQPWSMPGAAAGGLAMAWATKRWRSAWFGIIAHSAQSVLIVALTFALVVS
jgi:membrane protease YdiL (CAAX protease family)